MKVFPSDSSFVVVLAKGESLTESLTSFMQDAAITSAWVQGLGAALSTTLVYYNLETKQYYPKEFTGPLELTALQGNVVRGPEGPLLHLHGSFSDTEYRGIGGHIQDMIVGGTCELHIQPLTITASRAHDNETGLNLLCEVPPHATA
jgi:predicted DNA-binding protein with PD1-like motif